MSTFLYFLGGVSLVAAIICGVTLNIAGAVAGIGGLAVLWFMGDVSAKLKNIDDTLLEILKKKEQ